MYSDQDEFETHRCRGGLSPTTHYHPGVIDHRPTVGLAPEELLVLPASFSGEPLAGPRRGDLFSTLRRQQEVVSSREKRRRRRVASLRRSEDVLAGMLARSGREAHTSISDQRNGRGSSCTLALLRAGRPRPEIQQLHRPEEIGLGQAMGLTGCDSSSDLGSGISEWAPGDGDNTAAFEELIEEETRAVRGFPVASTITSKSISRSPKYPLRSSCRAESKRRSVQSEEIAEHSAAPRARPTRLALVTKKSTVDTHSSSTPEESSPTCQRATTQAQPSPSSGVRDAETRDEGVQCTGPPVDQGVQTSAFLRLPRKTIDTQPRIFEPKFLKESLVDQHNRSTPLETSARKLTVDSQQQRPHDTTSSERAGTTAAQVHVRVGLEGMRDADRGQQPTVWGVASGEGSSGPVLMLSLEGDNTKRGGVRKYLSVTDFPSEQKFGEGSGDSDERGRCEEQKRPSVEVSNNWEDVEEGEEDEEQRPNRYLDPLWEGLGSLGERLAGVNARFDQLDQEIKHDRDVIESYQREAWKEADMASKDLADIRARKLVPAPSNPLLKAPWRNREVCSDELRIGTPPPSKQNFPSAFGRESFGVGDGKKSCKIVEDAAVQAEKELREARAILQSIEEKLRPGTGTADGQPPSAPETPALGGPTTASVGASKLAPEPPVVPSTPRPRHPAGCRKSANRKHFQRLGLRPTSAFGFREDRQASGRFNGHERAKGTGRVSRSAHARDGANGARSVGTAVAHFPTALLAAKSGRGRKATRRAWA